MIDERPPSPAGNTSRRGNRPRRIVGGLTGAAIGAYLLTLPFLLPEWFGALGMVVLPFLVPLAPVLWFVGAVAADRWRPGPRGCLAVLGSACALLALAGWIYGRQAVELGSWVAIPIGLLGILGFVTAAMVGTGADGKDGS